MSYWLMLSTLYWAASFGNYATLADCEHAAKSAPWYVTAWCMPQPETKGQ